MLLALGICAVGVYALGSDYFAPPRNVLYGVRAVEVRREKDSDRDKNALMREGRDEVYWGSNYVEPAEAGARGDSQKDFTRLATTYFHRRGPVGQVMERFNWFPGPANTYWADSRMPASLVGLAAAPLGVANLPTNMLVGVWSEPPYAVIGMEVGTMASYSRPFQHVHFYEHEGDIIRLSLPPRGQDPYFRFVKDATQRGAEVRVFEGDQRQTLAKHGPRGFYHVIVLEMCQHADLDDVAVDLLTREAMTLCFDKLSEDGILCIHTSNRYLDVYKAIADVAHSLRYACKHAQNQGDNKGDPDHFGLFSSEWVMIARRPSFLSHLVGARDRNDQEGLPFWDVPEAAGKHVWTDKGRDPLVGLYRGDPALSRLRNRLVRATDNAGHLATLLGVPQVKVFPITQRVSSSWYSSFRDLERFAVMRLNRSTRGPGTP